jgi:hypothetical protein
MATSGETLGSRDVFVPRIPSTGWGALLNRFLRSFANLNVTKFSILPWVPSGTYLGGYRPDVSPSADDLPRTDEDETYDVTSVKTNRLFKGVRRLPVLGGANNSFFTGNLAGATLGKQYLFDPTRAKNTVVTVSNNLSIDSLFSLNDNSVFGDPSTFKKDEDYVVFDMSRTYVMPFDPQFNLLVFAKGYLPFHKVCDISAEDTSTSRVVTSIYPTGTIGGGGVISGFATVDPTLVTLGLKTSIGPGELFCNMYYHQPLTSVPSKWVYPGVAHVLFVEFGDSNQIRYQSSVDDLASV